MGKIAMPRRESVTVSVVDEDGDFVPSADVKLTSLNTGDEFAAERGDDAKYHFANREPGVYTLEVSSGPAVAAKRTVRVRRDRPVEVSVGLMLGDSFVMGDVADPEPR